MKKVLHYISNYSKDRASTRLYFSRSTFRDPSEFEELYAFVATHRYFKFKYFNDLAVLKLYESKVNDARAITVVPSYVNLRIPDLNFPRYKYLILYIDGNDKYIIFSNSKDLKTSPQKSEGKVTDNKDIEHKLKVFKLGAKNAQVDSTKVISTVYSTAVSGEVGIRFEIDKQLFFKVFPKDTKSIRALARKDGIVFLEQDNDLGYWEVKNFDDKVVITAIIESKNMFGFSSSKKPLHYIIIDGKLYIYFPYSNLAMGNIMASYILMRKITISLLAVAYRLPFSRLLRMKSML